MHFSVDASSKDRSRPLTSFWSFLTCRTGLGFKGLGFKGSGFQGFGVNGLGFKGFALPDELIEFELLSRAEEYQDNQKSLSLKPLKSTKNP